MKLDDVPESANVEDRRSESGGGGGLGGGLPIRAGHLGIGGVLLLLVLAFLLHINPMDVLNGTSNLAPGQQPSAQASAPTDTSVDPFVKKILTTTEQVWTKQFADGAMKYYDPNATAYADPKLVLYAGSIATGCGGGDAAMGPFYCPNDSKVYLDTSFFDDLRTKFAAPGQFAEGYVIAHEVGHHVQDLVGITANIAGQRAGASEKERNALSVKVELQADCFAGVWGHEENAAGRLDPGEMNEALNAATQIGDDRLQKQAQGYVVPDSFTHGTSAQRVRWFKRGFDSGDVKQCDTFKAASL